MLNKNNELNFIDLGLIKKIDDYINSGTPYFYSPQKNNIIRYLEYCEKHKKH